MKESKNENPPIRIIYYAVEIAKLIKEIGKEEVIKKLQKMVEEAVEKFDVK